MSKGMIFVIIGLVVAYALVITALWAISEVCKTVHSHSRDIHTINQDIYKLDSRITDARSESSKHRFRLRDLEEEVFGNADE